MERTLALTICVNGDNIKVDICEPESGEAATVEAPFSPDEHPEFNQVIGDEVYSWISLWKDAEDEEGDA